MSQSGNVDQLFAAAASDGILSKAALNAINVSDIGDEINNALGVSVDDVQASEVVLVTTLIDDSSSIRFISGNTEAVRDGHNLILDSLGGAKPEQQTGVLVSTSYLNGGLLFPYAQLANAVRIDNSNYDPNGGTPLYRQARVTLATVLAKCQDFQDNGIACRTVTSIVTDGGDNGGMRGADQVKKIVDDMLRAENHIIIGVGIDDGNTDFWEVFTGHSKRDIEAAKANGTFDQLRAVGGMGIQPQWVLTPKNSPKEIRRAFLMVSQSAQRVSQSAKAFSQAAMGGFGAP